MSLFDKKTRNFLSDCAFSSSVIFWTDFLYLFRINMEVGVTLHLILLIRALACMSWFVEGKLLYIICWVAQRWSKLRNITKTLLQLNRFEQDLATAWSHIYRSQETWGKIEPPYTLLTCIQHFCFTELHFLSSLLLIRNCALYKVWSSLLVVVAESTTHTDCRTKQRPRALVFSHS